MIITKTPFRMSFFGGGTDLPEFFNDLQKKNKEIVPYWLEHPEVCKSDLATPEEIAEMDELLKEFKQRGEMFMKGEPNL